MTLLQTFEDICNNRLTPRVEVIYGELDSDPGSVARQIDTIKKAKFPILVILPYTVTDSRSKSGYIKSKAPFEAFMLTRMADQRTVDFTHKEAEAKAIEPMRILARNFISFLNASEIIDLEEEGVVVQEYIPTYAKGDNALFGVHITKCVIPFHETTNTVCTD